jgi:hypothetical protein
VWDSKVHDAMMARSDRASNELGRLMEDIKDCPINYNRYCNNIPTLAVAKCSPKMTVRPLVGAS